MWLLLRLAQLAWLALVFASVVVLLIFLTHPRDEDAVLAYFKEYGTDRQRETVHSEPEQMLSQADEACAWLHGEAGLLLQPSTQVRHDDLQMLYMDSEDYVHTAPPSVAWENLCGGTYLLIRGTHFWQKRSLGGD